MTTAAEAQHSLLDLIATDPTPLSDVDRERALFLDACEQCARENDGLVYVDRVRQILDGSIYHKRIGSLFSHLTGPNKPMRRTDQIAVSSGEGSVRNVGKLQPVRRWIGEQS